MKRPLAGVAASVACLLLTGCAATVTLTPAPEATSVGCAKVVVGLRNVQSVGAAERRVTDAQGTAAWGSPASVTLVCGVQTPEASALKCFTLDGVNWLRQTLSGREVLTTFGRVPGVQIVIIHPSSVTDAVQQLSAAVADGTEATDKRCLSTGDPTSTPSPALTRGASPSSVPRPTTSATDRD